MTSHLDVLVFLRKKKCKYMKNNLESSEISSSEWLSLNQFLHEIKQINSSCVSVYYPYGKGQETISLLQETKKNESFEKIESKIESRIAELRKSSFCRQVYKNPVHFWMDKKW